MEIGLLGLPQPQPELQEDAGPQEQGEVGRGGPVSIPLLGAHAGLVPVVKSRHLLNTLLLTTALSRGCYYHSHFSDEESGAQSGLRIPCLGNAEGTCPPGAEKYQDAPAFRVSFLYTHSARAVTVSHCHTTDIWGLTMIILC